MQNQTVDKTIAWLALLCGIAISSVAIWFFCLLGLVVNFSQQQQFRLLLWVTVLEIGKLVATVWLKFNWDRTPFLLKSYLLSAIIVLMFITSMGIFGYLSKAHIEQTMPTGDAFAQIQIIDSQIELQQDVISQAQQELNILNNQIQEYTDRGFVTRGVEARAAQAGERERLFNQISTAQSSIAELRSTRAPYDQTVRTIEAEVGPLKYIAAVIYGDSIDSALLEQAVRWVIIIIIFVFDPLAVLLLLSAQVTFIDLRSQQIKEKNTESLLSNAHIAASTLLNVNLSSYRKPHIPTAEAIQEVTTDAAQEVTTDAAQDATNLPGQPELTGVDWDSADSDILEAASAEERAAMMYWKSKHPTNYIMQQYILLSEGTITELPWLQYINTDPAKRIIWVNKNEK